LTKSNGITTCSIQILSWLEKPDPVEKLNLLERRDPGLAGLALGAQRLTGALDVAELEGVGDTGVDGHAGEALELLVRAEQVDLDARDHLGDGEVRDARERRLAEAEEVEVRRVAEVEELEVVLPQRARAGEQLEVVGLQVSARALAGAGGDDLERLDVRKRLEGDALHLLDQVADLDEPVVVELVPVHEVVAGALHEVLGAGGDVGLGGRHRRQVGVAVHDAVVDAVGRRDQEVPRVVLRQRHDRHLHEGGVPRQQGLGPVHTVLEPEHRVLVRGARGAARRGVRVQLLPAFSAGRSGDLRREREPSHAFSF
jgi:hypothetical protein